MTISLMGQGFLSGGFYILPCSWNRQLCIWWKDKGYESVFDLYFKCEGHINIYHGNCNTEIPKLDWEK
jgi:hypothetical protein